MRSNAASLADSVGFELVGADLGRDVESALHAARMGRAVFAKPGSPLCIFRETLAASIRAIETHHREPLFREFLLKGPYWNPGPIPAESRDQHLSDTEVAAVVTFVYAHMVNSFEGALTELLALRACVRLLKQLQRERVVPENARLYVGDVVSVRRTGGKGVLKGADFHILIEGGRPGAAPHITVAGLAEVKSYPPSKRRLSEQLDRHARRAELGLQVAGQDYSREQVTVGLEPSGRALRIAVQPSDWRLPRTFWYEPSADGRTLQTPPGVPPRRDDEVVMTGDDDWRITLRWSQEALAAAAFEMTFWYLEKVGEAIYRERRPNGWEGMRAAEAGRNAAKMMLYYALLRCRTDRENQRAIALYNMYGFGYALGMSFRNSAGRREMLWPEDLDEILLAGKTKSGCSLC